MPPDAGGPPGPRAWLRRVSNNLARARGGFYGEGARGVYRNRGLGIVRHLTGAGNVP